MLKVLRMIHMWKHPSESLTRLLPMYEYFVPKSPAWAAIFKQLCNSTTHQSLVVKSCSNL